MARCTPAVAAEAGLLAGSSWERTAWPYLILFASRLLTAMTACALLKISKAEMVRVLHQEPALSDVFVSFLLTRNARVQADPRPESASL